MEGLGGGCDLMVKVLRAQSQDLSLDLRTHVNSRWPFQPQQVETLDRQSKLATETDYISERWVSGFE